MVGSATFDYTGETAIVTGSTKGIGKGIATALVKAGANVVVNSRSSEAVSETASELSEIGSGDVIGIAADVGNIADIKRLVADSVDEFGEVSMLINNAAMWPREGSMLEASLDDWEATMNVNVRSQFYTSQLVAKQMVENDIEGVIINHTSQTGDRRTGDRGFYGISKTAINGLTWRMAINLAEYGIRVNAISTDVADTHQLRYEAGLMAEDDDDRTPEEVLAEWGANIPLGRLGTAEDLANAVLFLGSDRADYITGEIVRVSGGGNLK